MIHPSVKIHPTAIIEEGVSIGAGTSVWDNVHIRKNTVIGENCIIGEKTYIAYDVKIGNGVKINSFVYICTSVTIEDQVMISAGTVFTNDRFPRAFDMDGHSVKTSDPTEETLETKVRRGVTIGAGCTIGPGIELDEFCMVGMGSVVTKNVLPYQLVYGNPAKSNGFVCICGDPLMKIDARSLFSNQQFICTKCRRQYQVEREGIKLKVAG
jgi:UDP-2-acetamido-3-amino-2,3-dideoxy-glucuronate N-acetyltransferase